MRRFLLTLLAGLLLTGPAAAAEAIKLRPAVSLEPGPVKLAAIAELNAEQAAGLGRITVAKLPQGPGTLSLSRERILRAIRKAHPGEVSLEGASQVKISPQFASLGREELTRLYVAKVMQASPWTSRGRIEISDIRVPENLNVPAADLKRLTAEFAPREDFLGPVCLDLKFGSSRQARLNGRVQVYASVPVSRGLKPGQAVTADAIEVRELELSGFGTILTSPEQCRGLRAKTTIRPGQPLQRCQLEAIPLVCRGATVMLEATAPGLVITDSGQALRDGFASDRIPVKNLSSGRTVIGTVIAPSRVRVVF